MNDSSPTKRICGVFDRLIRWIESQQGFVHSSIEIDTESRTVRTKHALKAGTTVFRIPQSVLVSLSCLPEGDDFVWNQAYLLSDDDDDNRPLSSYTKKDVRLALYCASRPKHIQPYLDSLPYVSDLLPRQWSPEWLDLLQGSPLLFRIQAVQDHLKSDYERLAVGSPSFADFSNAMATISSRAFEFDGPTLVPLLDLCNHQRKHKNLSYKQQDVNGEIAVLVQTTCDIDGQESLQITYGARGNGQLLLNYGFCLEDNLEADGSANSVFDFSIKDGGLYVELRTGGKSYTYGCFVSALEHFVPDRHEHKDDEGDEYDESSMESFLNGCDEDDGVDCFEAVDEPESKESSSSPLKTEVEALTSFASRLVELQSCYKLKGDDLKQALSTDASIDSRRLYIARLIQSELRTIYFYQLAIHRLGSKLASNLEDCKYFQDGPPMLPSFISQCDGTSISGQVNELIGAYMQIRHSSF